MSAPERRIVATHMAALEAATGANIYDLSLPYWDHNVPNEQNRARQHQIRVFVFALED